jgi:hypothetical protein
MKKFLFNCVLIGISFCFSTSYSSVLSDLAANLLERTWVQMPQNDSLNGLKMDYSLLYWADGGVWDPARKRMYWVGGPGTCCANPAIYKLISYDENSDYWKIRNTPYSGSGHSYDGNALDPITGNLYFGRFYDKKVKKFNGKSWSTLPEIPWTAVTPALDWFPDINNRKGGLVFSGEGGQVAWFDGSSWREVNDGQSWNGYNNFSEYNPVHKLVWLGQGNNHYKLDAQLKMTKLKSPPLALQIGSTIECVEPVSGKFLVMNMDGDEWWEFDIINDKWTKITNMINVPHLRGNTFLVSIPNYGVIMAFNNSGSTGRAYIYKHVQSIDDTLAPSPPSRLNISVLSESSISLAKIRRKRFIK